MPKNRILLGNRRILSKNCLKQNTSFEMVMVHISLCLFPSSKCHQKGVPSVASSREYLLSSRTNERLLVLANTSPIFLPFTCSSTSTINIVLLAHQIITMFAMTLQSGTSDAWTIVLEHLMENVVDWGLFTILQYLVLSTLHSAKSVLCDTVYYNVYSNISSNISCLRIEHYKQMRILKYCQSRAVSGILANL